MGSGAKPAGTPATGLKQAAGTPGGASAPTPGGQRTPTTTSKYSARANVGGAWEQGGACA